MEHAMKADLPSERLVLVSCVQCGRLHEPLHPMVFNPVCPTCATDTVADQPKVDG